MTKHKYTKGEQSSWKWLADLAIGEESDPLAEVGGAYITAKRIGIKVEVRRLASGDFIIRRVA